MASNDRPQQASSHQHGTQDLTPPTGAHEISGPQPVNAFSRLLDPRRLFPIHFDFLMRDLYQSGQTPEDWRVIDAAETKLDENGMEVEFTLVRHVTAEVWQRRVLVCAGKLMRIAAP